MESNQMVMALDVGSRRIGVAVAHATAQLPYPLMTLEVRETVMDDIQHLCKQHDVARLIIGLPRNLSGDDTDQTRTVRAFVADLQRYLPAIKIDWQDEALTSIKAEHELKNRQKAFAKADIDALAATYILEDYLRDNPIKVIA